MTKPPKKDSPKTSVSPSSGYLLYGRGSREDYEREVQRVKAELRAQLYASEDDGRKDARPSEKKSDRTDKKRLNIAAIFIFASAVLSILVAAVYAILVKTGADVGGRDVVAMIVAFAKSLSDIVPDVAFGCGLCAIVATVFCLTCLIGAAVSVKRDRVGKLMLTGTVLWTAALLALTVLEVVRSTVVPIEVVLLLIFAAIALLCAAIGGKKKGGK
ncbi:MAG: hypothetical protein IJ735_04800 [Clostridia bacterium]|nr:hypothetical protein [Clostridia bacterium]